MKSPDYDISNFITVEFFIQWIKNADESKNHFWEKWIAQHLEERPIVNTAAKLICSVKYSPSPEFTDRMYVEAYEQILKGDYYFPKEKPTVPVKSTSPQTLKLLSFLPLRSIPASLLVLYYIWSQYEAL